MDMDDVLLETSLLSPHVYEYVRIFDSFGS